MAEKCGTADYVCIRICLPEFSQKFHVMVTPRFRLPAVIVIFHKIIRMVVILSYSNYNNLRCVLGEIPLCHRTKCRVVVNLIPHTFHANLIRLLEPSYPVHERYPSLGYVMNLCFQLSCSNPRIRIPAIRITAIVYRVFLSNKVDSLRYFTR